MSDLPGWLLEAKAETPPCRLKGRKLVVQKSLEDFAAFQRQILVRQEWARYPGVLQSLDPRLKIVVVFSVCLMAAWSQSPFLCLLFLGVAGGLAWFSRIPPKRFFSWQWLIFPVLSLVATSPALTSWITPGPALFRWGPFVVTRPGVSIVLLLFLRTTTSLSWMMLLVSTTSWERLLKGARGLHLPGAIAMTFAIFLNYLLALVRRLEALHLGRMSRLAAKEKNAEGYRWLGAAIASLFHLTDRLGRDIGEAMEARGYQGDLRLEHGLVWKHRDTLALMIGLIGGCFVFAAF